MDGARSWGGAESKDDEQGIDLDGGECLEIEGMMSMHFGDSKDDADHPPVHPLQVPSSLHPSLDRHDSPGVGCTPEQIPSGICTPVETPGGVTQKGRALVVDDTATVLKIARRTLALAGYEVETAENGQEALEMLKALYLTGKEEVWFAVVVMDLQMPIMGESSYNLVFIVSLRVRRCLCSFVCGLCVMFTQIRYLVVLSSLCLTYFLFSPPTHTSPTDGIECVKRFRAFERARALEATAAGLPVRKRLPIIACSANDSDELKRDVIKAGMDGFMPKPCTRVKLALAIERIELDALEDKPILAVSKSVCF